uniref:hypothetical protein n=1 Tax=Timspurckia oligopyrenoides TaxID=708627 RepID=UPI001FCD8810|nr:hypothetical protein MW591_pgp005 [Timspurckia oligopyrenoides]UNJ17610.1 hypothetical protein [Timspurckia oligopyrenoides]
MDFTHKLTVLLKARSSLIYICTDEEKRLEYMICETLKGQDTWQIHTWDFVSGYTSNPSDLGRAARDPIQAIEFAEGMQDISTKSIFVLKDFDCFFNDISIGRRLKNFAYRLKSPANYIILGSTSRIPSTLQAVINVIDFPLPNNKEIRYEVMELIKRTQNTIDSSLIDKISSLCRGMTLERIKRLLVKVIASNNTINKNCISCKLILEEKKQIINKTQILEFYSTEEKIGSIGGLRSLKRWLRLRKDCFSRKAKLYGLPTPKGLLLVGIQGTGKSLTAKVIANEWGLPLLKLEACLFSGIVGESELKVRNMIKTAESMAPAILWIDEIDKAFSGIYSQSDGGTASRVFGTLTSWLSEKKEQVFVIATANNVQNLPSELIRKGRFDEIFFLGLPNRLERQEILETILRDLRPTTYREYNLEHICNFTDRFSGAELRQIVIDSMYIAYNQGRGKKFKLCHVFVI